MVADASHEVSYLRGDCLGVLSQSAVMATEDMMPGIRAARRPTVADFKGSHFEQEIILWGARLGDMRCIRRTRGARPDGTAWSQSAENR